MILKNSIPNSLFQLSLNEVKMMEIVLASNNKHKVVELEYFINKMCLEKGMDSIKVLTLNDIGFMGDIVEDGKTFEENAVIKASAVAKLGYIGVADDSGLCVDHLSGAPGIYSARYSGNGDDANNEKLLYELRNVTGNDRSAKFVCAIACAFPDGKSFTVIGECPGVIGHSCIGDNGFGYDPLFYTPVHTELQIVDHSFCSCHPRFFAESPARRCRREPCCTLR